MLRTLIFTLLTILVTPACSECMLTNGIYEKAGGSEQSTTLTLSANKKFTLTHKNWQPGQYEKQQTISSNGNWTCNQDRVTLKFKNKSIQLKTTIAGKNPLELNPKTKVLSFGEISDSSLDYLSNEILYLETTFSN